MCPNRYVFVPKSLQFWLAIILGFLLPWRLRPVMFHPPANQPACRQASQLANQHVPPSRMGRKSARIGSFSYRNHYISGPRSSWDFCEFLLPTISARLGTAPLTSSAMAVSLLPTMSHAQRGANQMQALHKKTVMWHLIFRFLLK